MNSLGSLGWTLLLSGVVVTSVGYVVTKRLHRDGKVSVGVAALIALIWFIAVADWLPPSWKDFWTEHSLTASTVVSGLGVFAAWIFLSARARKRRTVALYNNLFGWLASEGQLLEEWLDSTQEGPEGWPVLRQRVLVASVISGLSTQQQWITSAFTVLLTREASDEEAALMEFFARLRKHGGRAIRNLAGLEAYLAEWPGGHVPADDVGSGRWHQVSADLMNLQQGVRQLNEFLGDSSRAITAAIGR